MANIVSYNDIIELMRSIAERHYQINTFFLGRDWELENNQDIQYPILQVFPQFASMPINNWKEYKTLELTLNCKVVDLTTPAEENEMDVHSDTLRISQDIVNELNQHPYYIRSNVSLMETINFEAIEEFKDDISAGWKFQLKLRIINANTFCGMPIAELDGISANGPTSSGQYVNVRYLTCETLPDCPVIIDIQEAIAGLTGATAMQGLPSVLGIDNTTNNIPIYSPDLNNVLQVTDTVLGLSWNETIGGNVTLDDSGTYVYSDAPVYVESQTDVNITGPNVNVTGTGFRVDTTDNAHMTTDNSLYLAKVEELVKPTKGYVLTYTLDKNTGLNTSINVETSGTDNIVEISSNNPNFVGAIYNADYSANFLDESLITKRWVSNYIGTASAPSSLYETLVIGATTGGIPISSDNGDNRIIINDLDIDISRAGNLAAGRLYMTDFDNTLSHDTQNIFSSPLHIFKDMTNNVFMRIDSANHNITLTASATSSMTMNQYNTTFTGNVTVTSNNDNAGISIVSPPGFYYPSIGFYNVGNNFLGAITGYAGQLYIGGVSGTPLIVNSAAINLPLETVNSLLYVDSGNNVKSAHLGVGLSFSGLTLSTTNNKFSYTDASNGITSVSNSNTLSKSVLIPANTLTKGALNIKGRSHKSGTGSFAWLIIYVNTTNSLSGASEIGRINNSSNNTVLHFSIDRTIPIKVGSFTAFIINAITGYEEAITNNVSAVTIDWTVDQYIILAVQANGGASPSESLVANFLSVNQF